MQKSPNFICANIIKVSSALFSLAVCLTTYPSFAAKVQCNAGEYLPAGSNECEKCTFAEAPDNFMLAKNDTFKSVPWLWRMYCPGGKYEKGLSTVQGIKDCAFDYEDVDENYGYGSTKDMKGCEPKTVKCDKGEYLPAESDISSGCKSCNSLDRSNGNWVCPDSNEWFWLGDSNVQGVKQCEDKQIPNYRTGMDKCYYCPTGLVANRQTINYNNEDIEPYTLCVSDANIRSLESLDDTWGYFSQDFVVSISNVTPPKTVSSISTPNLTTETTEPISYGKVNTSSLFGMGKATCDAGQVWDNGKCVSCTSKSEWVNYANENRMYCAGVKNISVIGLKLQDQLTQCPAGMWPTDGLKDCECGYGLTKKLGKCVGSLSYDDMYYGPHGKNAPLFKQCWTKSHDEKAYKKCMGFDD